MPWDLRADEPAITAGLVRALVSGQHPDLADLPIGDSVRGWDNTMVRLGERLAVRLPRHAPAEELLDREVVWLPRLSAQIRDRPVAEGPASDDSLPAIPTPVRTGVSGAGFPFRWAIVPWVSGTSAVRLPVEDRDAYASDLAATLNAIHQPAPDDAPTSPFRGTAPADIVDRFSRGWDALGNALASDRRDDLAARWDEALTAPPHPGPRVWLHGDPHPNNTVLADVGEGAAGPVLVDFGDLCAGDPASDLGSALLHFSATGRRVFRAAYDARRPPEPGREALWMRARGWSVYFALILAAQPEGEALQHLGRDYLG